MRTLSVLLAFLALFSTAGPAPPASYATLQQQAEALYAEKSFGRAHALYEETARLALTPSEKRWVDFRLADTSWRADSANPSADDTQREAARKALDALIEAAGDDHDRVWAEGHESLADYWLTRMRTFAFALPNYTAALDWWGGSDDLPLARRRYLGIVFRITDAGEAPYPYGYYSIINLPREVLINAAAIAEEPQDLAHARVLLAQRLLQESKPESVERALELFDEVIAAGKTTPWYDDALFAAAKQLSSAGAVVVENGEVTYKPDNLKALALYRRLLNEFAHGETRYYPEAQTAATLIESPSVSVMTGGPFLPRSEQELILTWRNVKDVELTITAIDLVTDVQFATYNFGTWQQSMRSDGRRIRRWTFQTNDRGDHAVGTERIRLTPKVDPGAYVLVGSATGARSQTLLLVTDSNIVAHQSNGRADLFVCNATTGEPMPNARVRAWRQEESRMVSVDATTNANGLATIRTEGGGAMLVLASAPNGRQAWLSTWNYREGGDEDGQWSVYAFTDRPAYRPDETVHWKFIARVQRNGQWVTPAKAALDYEIYSPRDEKVASGTATLNDFGSFWADLPLTAAMPLGEYSIRFQSRDAKGELKGVGDAQLFRLEEYKLPEFRVEVKTPEKNGKKLQYRLGDTVEATIEASYYFGGPVANATVEVVVYHQPFVHYWAPWRKYEWYYPESDYGYGPELKRETLKTDAQGRAVVRIETGADAADTAFHIEARVTDASRREVSGGGTVNVTSQRFTVLAHPAHYLLRPGDNVSVDFKAVDANDQPVQTAGTVNVIRRRWQQPQYQEEEILTTTLNTDGKGEATLEFRAPREGYYVVRWKSEDGEGGEGGAVRARDIVRAETSVWVTDSATADLGYHAGGLEIIVDKESFRAGETAPAMIVTPASGRWVMLTTSGDKILDTQILHLDGTVKLVQVKVDDRHVPSFTLTASSVFDRMLAGDEKTIVVPPVEHFIDVEVKPDRAEYLPRQEGTVTVTARDVDGKPVRAEVALAVSDESVTAIQSDFAGDPRQFFFGELRGNNVRVEASVRAQRYLNLVEEKGKLIDDREIELRKRRDTMRETDASTEGFFVDGVDGGVVGGVVGGSPAPPPPPPPGAVTEQITVTAAASVVAVTKSMNAAIDVHVRSDFRSTAFWQPDVVTGADGTARVTLKFPEALTTWRATARAVTTGTQVGMGSATARTNMPLIVRLQAPRFFVAGDRATVSAVINNNTDAAMTVTPSMEAEGIALQTASTLAPLDVPAHGEARADWKVVAERAGPARLLAKGVASTDGNRADAMEKTYTVFEHGVDKLVARSGKLRGTEAIVKLDLPPERRATALAVQVQPSLAVTMLDALPYLIDYPYGCTEQTMSRFLPAAIVARTLARSGLDAADIEGRIFGGIERATASKTHPEGAKDLRRLREMTAASMARLYDFQHGDGGWGWWKDGNSDDFMTAYVVWGFAVAKEGALNVDEGAVRLAVQYLDRKLVENENRWQEQAWMLHAIAAWRAATHDNAMNAAQRRAFENVWSHRERLTAYSRALFALAAHDFGEREKSAVLIRNLEDGVKRDRAPDQSVLVRGAGSSAAETMGTAHWGEDRFWWRWHDGPVESTAFALQALVRIDPKNELIEPVMNWLVKNRRGAQWNNTRDTAVALLALNDYLGASGELAGDVAYEVSVNGVVAGSQPAGSGPLGRTFTIDPTLVREANAIRIRRTGGEGAAPLYFSVEARFVSLEEPVKAAGNEIFVRRQYVRLAPKPTLLKGVTYDRLPLGDGGAINSGERVEVAVTIESKNDYDYLLFEDLKPAGLEAVSLQSGGPLFAQELKSGGGLTGRTAWVYQELRDRKIALFIDHLPQGIWEIRYTLRAEVPGVFHALPLLGQAMYVPEIRANGDEIRMTVNEGTR